MTIQKGDRISSKHASIAPLVQVKPEPARRERLPMFGNVIGFSAKKDKFMVRFDNGKEMEMSTQSLKIYDDK